MRARPVPLPARMRSRGLSLITAVFLLVALAVMSAAMVRLYVAQQASTAMDVRGSQAYQAALSGLEWGIHRQLRVQPPSVDCFAPSPQTFAMPAGSRLSGFIVTVTCTVKPGGNTAGETTNRWSLTAIACNQPLSTGCLTPGSDPDYVRRQVQAELN